MSIITPSLGHASSLRSARRRVLLRGAAVGLVLAGVSLLAAACGSRSDYYEGGSVDVDCRENPGDCEGDIGGGCEVSDDCSDGVCCQDGNCGRGMCTYLCDRNSDCPEEMACEHGYCFFRCSDDAQCGPGQSCEHGDTICEYEKD